MSFIVERMGPDYLFTKSNESALRFMLTMAKQRNENHPEVVEYSDEIGKSNKWGAESHPRHLLLTRRWIYLFRTHLVEMVMPKDMPVPGNYDPKACTRAIPIEHLKVLILSTKSMEFILSLNPDANEKALHGYFRDMDSRLLFLELLKKLYKMANRENPILAIEERKEASLLGEMQSEEYDVETESSRRCVIF